MEQRNWWPRGWRGLVLLVLGGVMAANLLSPAIADIGSVSHLWNKHIKPKADARYLLRPKGTQELWLAGSTWHDEDGGSALIYGQESWCIDNGGSGYLIQHLDLPQGAVITSYRAGYVDDGGSGASNGSAYLVREALPGRGGSYTDVTFVDLPDASGWTYADHTLPTPEVVDNTQYAYILLYWPNTGGMGACTAGVFYTPPGAPTTGEPARPTESHGKSVTNP